MHQSLKKIKELVIQAVKINGLVLEYVSDDLKNDFDSNKKVKNMYFCQFGFKTNDTTNSDNAIMNKLTAYKVICPEVGEFVWANGNYGINDSFIEEAHFNRCATKILKEITVTDRVGIFLE